MRLIHHVSENLILNNAHIDFTKCKIWHPSQDTACQRCRCLGHHTSEVSKCDAYTEDSDVITIRSPQYILCNYNPSPLKCSRQNFQAVNTLINGGF